VKYGMKKEIKGEGSPHGEDRAKGKRVDPVKLMTTVTERKGR